MAGIANTDANFAGWAAFCQNVFGRSNYLGDVAGDTIATLTGGTPGDWQTTHLGSGSTVKIVLKDGSVGTFHFCCGGRITDETVAIGKKRRRVVRKPVSQRTKPLSRSELLDILTAIRNDMDAAVDTALGSLKELQKYAQRIDKILDTEASLDESPEWTI
jgi:hypothetical protein